MVAAGAACEGTILRLSSWSNSPTYCNGDAANLAAISLTPSGHLCAEWRNTIGGNGRLQRLELPQRAADGQFHQVSLIRKSHPEEKTMQIGLVLDGQYAMWLTDQSGDAPIAFSQGFKVAGRYTIR